MFFLFLTIDISNLGSKKKLDINFQNTYKKLVSTILVVFTYFVSLDLPLGCLD